LSTELTGRGVTLPADQLEAARASLGAALGAAADGVSAGGAALADSAREAFTSALAVGSLVAAAVALVGAFAAWRWVPGLHSLAWTTPTTTADVEAGVIMGVEAGVEVEGNADGSAGRPLDARSGSVSGDDAAGGLEPVRRHRS
jgi:hypothetical protein